MRLLQWVMFWFLAPAAALALDAGPAETPPEGFGGRQYIDSRGCVFLRDESGGWGARHGSDGKPVCGYPPTLSQRGLDGRPRLRALDPDAGKSRAQLVEEALTRAVIPNLRAGELTSDPRPIEVLPDMGPEPHDSAPMDALRGALRAAPQVRAQMTRDLQPNLRLCALLGYDDSGKASGIGQSGSMGGDPTQGYCGNLPANDLSRLAFARPIGTPLQPAPSGAGSAVASARPLPSPATGQPDAGKGRAAASAGEKAVVVRGDPSGADKPAVKARANARPGPTSPPAQGGVRTAAPGSAIARTPATPAGVAKPEAPVPAPKNGSPAMIPAGARFVQFGRFADADAADRAAKTALALGYPVLRGKGQDGKPFLLAGPFDSREAIVRALNGLRQAGFRSAYPR